MAHRVWPTTLGAPLEAGGPGLPSGGTSRRRPCGWAGDGVEGGTGGASWYRRLQKTAGRMANCRDVMRHLCLQLCEDSYFYKFGYGKGKTTRTRPQKALPECYLISHYGRVPNTGYIRDFTCKGVATRHRSSTPRPVPIPSGWARQKLWRVPPL